MLLGDLVWIPDRREQGTVGGEIAPWSYEVETPSELGEIGEIRIISLLNISHLEDQGIKTLTQKK